MPADGTILVVNCGSSSVKFALFDAAPEEPQRISRGALQRIGSEQGRFVVADANHTVLVDESWPIPNHLVALDSLLAWVENQTLSKSLIAVGHRVVHGGDDCDCSSIVTPALERRLRQLIPLAPLHQPHNLAGLTAVRVRRPTLPQVACFDTAFHHGLPRVARLTGLPRRFEADGVRRYGFHGLSYEYVIDDVRRQEGHSALDDRIVIAHLGNGASMAAIKHGRSVDTTMGFSTLAGLPMGTRAGDLDPGIILYLLSERQVSVETLQRLLYDESGLLGVSDLTRNMADLLAQQALPHVREAIDYYCHHTRRHLAGLTTALGGLDRLVFTGGIGANSPEIRDRICQGLGYLGIELDPKRNACQERVVSEDRSPVVIQAIETDEELMIAKHTRNLLSESLQDRKIQAHG